MADLKRVDPKTAENVVNKLAAMMAPKGKPSEPTLEPLPPRPDEAPGLVGEGLAIVRRDGKFQLIAIPFSAETPHRVLKEIPSDSGIVASAVMINEIKARMMRVGLIKAPSVKAMKNVVEMPVKKA